jgi:hypothetical protein
MTSVVFEDPGEAAAFARYRIAQKVEYGTWVAAADLKVNGVLAFAAGHPVPISHVEAYGWDKDGSVVPSGTPLPDPAADRAEALRARRAALAAEQAAIEAELAETEPAGEADDSQDGPSDETADPPAAAKRRASKKSEE